jgi:hypothetical protein
MLKIGNLPQIAYPASLTYRPEFDIMDSTKLNSYAECPRKFFYEFIYGWRKASHHLVYGTMIHEAIGYLYEHGVTKANIIPAFELFVKCWNEHYPELEQDQLDRLEPKTPRNTLRLLELYVQHFGNERISTWMVEGGGSVYVDAQAGRQMVFKIDWIGEHERYGVCALEHKTSGYALTDLWAMQFTLRLQVGTYLHALKCLLPAKISPSVVINGLGLAREPKMKKDGTPYANSRDITFRRIPINRSNEAMSNWLFMVNDLWDRLEFDFTRMMECTEEHVSMQAFPMNPNACSSYAGCPYKELCWTKHNPLRLDVDHPPDEFIVDHWNPCSQHKNSITDLEGEVL